MKKFLCLFLALVCIFSVTSCDGDDTTGGNNAPQMTAEEKFINTVSSSEPTKITTIYSYVTADGDALNSRYVTEIQENGFKFDYRRARFASVEEALSDPIVYDEGVIYYKDGKYSTDGETWFSEAPDIDVIDMMFKVSFDNLGENYSFNEDYTALTATLTNEQALGVFGIAFAAEGDITLTVNANQKYLTKVSVSYVTASGATVSLDTSYTYNK